ncbi:hypothetical protein L1049_010681 [Liquidambar formosana]|uniref:Uncharacterized protein n=1 Tax=Liquidambar formosana TaxID=63359 RepID=A0AAP0N8Y7_LIQFO
MGGPNLSLVYVGFHTTWFISLAAAFTVSGSRDWLHKNVSFTWSSMFYTCLGKVLFMEFLKVQSPFLKSYMQDLNGTVNLHEVAITFIFLILQSLVDTMESNFFITIIDRLALIYEF